MLVEEWKRKNPPIQRKPITNADRIRQMSDEELAVICEDGCPPKHECPTMDILGEIVEKSACQRCWLEWLKEEVKEVEEVKDND